MSSARLAFYSAIFLLATGTLPGLRAQPERETGVQTGDAGRAGYEFTIDWVSNNVETWKKHLGEFRGKPAIRALEIGSYEGRSAIWFLEEILTHPSSRITCVDLFEIAEVEARFDHNLEASGEAFKVDKIKGDSQMVLRQLGGQKFDFIYIDGSHTARDVLLDAALSWGLLKEGGLVVFDDYRLLLEWHPWRRPKMAIDAFLEVFGPYLDVVHHGYQVIVRKRLPAEIPPLPQQRILGWRDVLLYLLTGLSGALASAALWRAPGARAVLLRAVPATIGAAVLGWAYTQEFEVFVQLKQVAGFNAFSTLGSLLPSVVGAVLGLALFGLLQGWRRFKSANS